MRKPASVTANGEKVFLSCTMHDLRKVPKYMWCVYVKVVFLCIVYMGVSADFNEVLGKPVILEGPRNATVLSGSSVLFRCAVAGEPEITISWQKNGRSLHHAGHANYRILESGDLKLDNVGLADDGLYHCIARNEKGMNYSLQARLRVEEPAKLKGGRSIYNVTWGSVVRLECSAQGEPPPIITWFQDGLPIVSLVEIHWPGLESFFFPNNWKFKKDLKLKKRNDLYFSDIYVVLHIIS